MKGTRKFHRGDVALRVNTGPTKKNVTTSIAKVGDPHHKEEPSTSCAALVSLEKNNNKTIEILLRNQKKELINIAGALKNGKKSNRNETRKIDEHIKKFKANRDDSKSCEEKFLSTSAFYYNLIELFSDYPYKCI